MNFWNKILLILLLSAAHVYAQRVMEKLDRGTVAIHKGGSDVYIGWRMLGTEPQTVGYNVYRDAVKITPSPITSSCNYLDSAGSLGSTYRVAAVIDGIEQELSAPTDVWSTYCHDVPLQRPAGGTTPDDVVYDYCPGDVSVGDLDGDGEYEIVLKWDPSNAKDNSHDGYTGNVYLDAYEMDGTFLWRIDLGINIRAGAHYTQFMVYDLDNDGKAEVVCKTADGTMDGEGTLLGNPSADWRNTAGRILDGPEYLSIFNGQTGAFIDTVDYEPPRGNVSDWGDSYGNRVDRFLACVAYLDGQTPSLVMCRGQYTRVVLGAWDFTDGELIQRWIFDSNDPGNSAYAAQGNHNLSVADVDGDGKDEIIYGSCTIDDDGTGLYSTGLGHGDSLHVSDMDPNRPGLEVWMPHESALGGATYRDAATGSVIWNHYNAGDVGRGVAAHIDSSHEGYQLWSYATGGVYTVDGTMISSNYSGKMMGHLVWWTGDLQREFLSAADGSGKNPVMEKWNGDGASRLVSLYSVPSSYDTKSINGTKATPCLSGDMLGDWREEIIYHSADKTKLRIFTTPEITTHRIHTLMHDPQYRLAIAWQNCGYNQPPHPSFYIGTGMSPPPQPNIAYPTDIQAPRALSATAGINYVSLDWADNSESNLTGYTVYRSTTSGTMYSTIASNLTESAYSDSSAVNGLTYYYLVTASVTNGNESAYSAEVSATPGFPTQQELSPVADTYVCYGINQNSNFGSNTTLNTRQNDTAPRDYIAYLRFDLSSISNPITNAVFQLTTAGGDTLVNGRVRVLGLKNVSGNTPQNWSETGLTWNSLGSEIDTTVYPSPVAGASPFDWGSVMDFEEGTSGIAETINSPSIVLSGSSLTDWLESRRLDGGLATLIIDFPAHGASNDKSLNYHSREAADHHPKLIVSFQPPVAPSLEGILSGGKLRFNWPGEYSGWTLEYCTNLSDVTWVEIPNSSSNNSYSVESAWNQAFYRLTPPN